MTKRFFDIVVSMCALIALAPLFLLISLLIVVDSAGSPFFRQVRVGKDCVSFNILKFRTMQLGAEQRGRLTVGGRDPRVTRVGYWLRRYKLDELPQLLNVLKGDMSLVGPRPEVEEFVALYNDRQLQVLSVRPGITDRASIEFSDENTLLSQYANPEAAYVTEILPRKLELNLEYIQTSSFRSDLAILFRTLCIRVHQ